MLNRFIFNGGEGIVKWRGLEKLKKEGCLYVIEMGIAVWMVSVYGY